MIEKKTDIYHRMLEGGIIEHNDPQMSKVWARIAKTIKLSSKLNTSSNIDEIRTLLIKITGKQIDKSSTIFAPFYTNFGKHLKIGKNVFINHACSFLDMGGITLEDDVLIGPKVNLITENHPINPKQRKSLVLQPILIKKNAWIGAGATILPGITIGKNAIVAAGAMVTKNVADNTLVGGIPAKFIKYIDEKD